MNHLTKDKRQELFNYFAENHDLMLMEDDFIMINDLICSEALPIVTFGQLVKSWLAKFSCHHKWNLHFEINVRNVKGKKIGVEQTLICDICGKFKKLKL
jgi:hypothetical protein